MLRVLNWAVYDTIARNLRERPPGSAQALHAGCICPVIGNHYGHGWCAETGWYVIDEACKLHSEWGDLGLREAQSLQMYRP